MAKSGNKSGGNSRSLKKAMEEEEGSRENYGFGSCTSGRFPLDALIRKHGWQIWRRKGREEPIWKKKDVEVRQSEVLLRINPDELADAEYQEFLTVEEGLE